MPSVTPDLLEALFGDSIDVEAVSKMGPDVSGVHVAGPLRPVRVRRKTVTKRALTPEEVERRQNLERNIARGSNVVGLGAGALALKDAVQNPALRGKVGQPVGGAAPKMLTPRVKRLAAISLGAQALNVGGDIVTTRVLGRDAKKAKAPVEKFNIPLGKLRTGRLSSLSSLFGRKAPMHGPLVQGANGAPSGVPFKAKGKGSKPDVPTPGSTVGAVPANATGPLTTGQVDAMSSAANVRQKVDNFTGSTGGRVTMGAAALGGTYVAGSRAGSRTQQEQAYYGKRHDVEIAGTFSKFDNDKKRAYGWASVVTMDGEPVVDRQGDYIGLEDIEEAAYTYVRKSRVAGDMHRRTAGPEGDAPHKAGELIESVVFTPDKCHAMGLPASFAGKWWMGVQVEDDEVWAEVKKGNRTGFSIHGRGVRKDTTLEEIRAGS